MPKSVYTATIIIVLLFTVNVFFVFNNSDDRSRLAQLAIPADDQEGQAYILPISEPNYIPILNSNILKPAIDAKSALVYDTRSSRFLYEKNFKTKLPVASLTKILTAIIVLENFNHEDIVTIPREAMRVDGEKQDLYLGEKISIRNLLKLMIIESSNDAAYALAWYAKSRGIDFIKIMNDKAGALGMLDSLFLDPAGLNDNAYSTANDLVKLIEYSLHYPEIWTISSEKTAIVESIDAKIKHNVRSTNQLLDLLTDIFGGKTGYTEEALGSMIMITDVPDYPSQVVSIILGSHDRFGDTQKLIDWTRRAYRWQ